MSIPAALRRRFEAIVLDWDGTAVPDRQADAGELRRLVEAACGLGLEVVVVSGTHVGNVDGQLRARPDGPGRLHLALNRGSELFRVDAGGPRLVTRRVATAAEEAALDRAAEGAAAALRAAGLEVAIVAARLNRRKLDLIPLPAWADPPKRALPALVEAVGARLRACGLDGLPAAVAIAAGAARAAGLEAPRVTSDAKHVEIGLTDKSDAARAIADLLREIGLRPQQALVCGDEVGPLGGVPGSDALLAIGDAALVSVGPEPAGVPAGVHHLGGGPATLRALLADQVERRRRRDPPSVCEDPGWALHLSDGPPQQERVREALLALGAGSTATRAALPGPATGSAPGVRIAGVYRGDGPESELLCGPAWNVLRCAHPVVRADRLLDLRTALLTDRVETAAGPATVVTFASLPAPGTMALRAAAHAGVLADGQGLAGAGAEGDTAAEAAVYDPPGSVAAAIVERRTAAPAGEERLERLAAYTWSRRAERRAGAPGPAARRAADAGYERLLHEHRRAWAARWAQADVRIEGDDELQRALRLALYHLMGSTPCRGEGPVGARGLTGDAYRGHVFWDAEAFVLPFHAATQPSAARAMLEYRRQRLPPALAAARAHGRAGALFPWESAAHGDEVTPSAALGPSGEIVPIRTGELEDHIVADIAWAADCYARWSGDAAFLAGAGRGLIVETARFWASRIVVAGGSAHIRGVIGPDEYHEDVDDNAFTNVMARWNLRRAAALVAGDASLADERRHWLALADALVDGLDTATGVYEQFTGFSALEDLRIADLAPRPVAAPLLLGSERVAGARIVKQADVLMLHYLVPGEVAPGSLAVNLDHYEPRTAHGSTLSPGVHAALFARAGRPAEAHAWLRTAAAIDLSDAGGTTAGGVHLAAMGSVWRAVAWGFLGLDAGADGTLTVDPRPLPSAWRSLSVRVVHRGVRIELRADAGGVHLLPAAALDVRVGDGPRRRVGRAGHHVPARRAVTAG